MLSTTPPGVLPRRAACPSESIPCATRRPKRGANLQYALLAFGFFPFVQDCEITNGPLAGMFIPRSVSIAPESDAAPEPTVCLN